MNIHNGLFFAKIKKCLVSLLAAMRSLKLTKALVNIPKCCKVIHVVAIFRAIKLRIIVTNISYPSAWWLATSSRTLKGTTPVSLFPTSYRSLDLTKKIYSPWKVALFITSSIIM